MHSTSSLAFITRRRFVVPVLACVLGCFLLVAWIGTTPVGAAGGELDATFQDPAVAVNSGVSALALQPDGKLIIGGEFTIVGGQSRARVARLNSDGTLDTSFLDPAVTGEVLAFALQPDGKIIIGGGSPQSAVSRDGMSHA